MRPGSTSPWSRTRRYWPLYSRYSSRNRRQGVARGVLLDQEEAYSPKEASMQVNLDANEVAALLDALPSYLSDLRTEIGHTENYEMRQQLKAREAALMSVISRLG